jgi:hypothetical protein
VSYLRSPRIHFAGRFQADTSTVNNDVRHFDSDQFCGEFQNLMEIKDESIVYYHGYWNPQGSGAWRLLGCKVTRAVLDGQVFDRPEDDPVVGLIVGGSSDRVAAKLVDLDPQQQMVSQIWGLSVRLQDDRGVEAFSSEFEVTAFCDIWWRQQTADPFFDQQMAAAYQSVLTRVKWGKIAKSPCLGALKAQSAAGLLSIRMNVFGYDRTPGAPDYGTGRVVGTIGPAAKNEPKHFVFGRQLIAAIDPSNPVAPLFRVSNIQAKVDESTQTVSVDFGNALPTIDSSGALQDLGPLAFGVLKDASVKQGDTVAADRIEVMGTIPYQDADWYFKTAGIQDFPFGSAAGVKEIINDHPLAVLGQGEDDGYKVLNRETVDGVYVRADVFVYRLNPGDSARIDFYATRYGQPLESAIRTWPTTGLMGGAGTSAKIPDRFTIPDIQTPTGIIEFKSEFQTKPNGHGFLMIRADEAGPGNPRGYLDGQLYGIGYQIKYVPESFNPNPFRYISILTWDKFEVPENPTWFEHVQPILSQYGNLYPIMSQRLVKLYDYDSVVEHRNIMKLSFSLPVENPNSMPVTRDLSANKRQTILNWLDEKDPVTGLPPQGNAPLTPKPQQAADPGPCELPANQSDLGSKVDFLRQVLKQKK